MSDRHVVITVRPDRPRPWSGRTLLACLLLLTVLAAACAREDAASTANTAPNDTSALIKDEGSPVAGGSLTIGMPAETPGWNQHDEQWPYWSVIEGSSVLEPLATVDKDLNVQPWLATSWTPNATFDSWTVKVRDGVTFHNGEKLDAAAVKLNVDDYLKGVTTGIVFKSLLKGATVVDPQTVQIDLLQPWAAFPNSFLAGQSFVMAPAMLNAPDRGKANPIGTGPYMFRSWQRDVSFKTVKNPSYWRPGIPHLDALDFTIISDPSAQSAAMQANNINMLFTLSYQSATALERAGYTTIKDWQSVPTMAMANTLPEVDGTPNPMSNLHARKALAYATDQQALAEAIGPGLKIPTSPISNNTKWGLPDDQTGYPGFDLQKAKDEVEQYKRETGAPSLTFTLSLSTDNDFLPLAQSLQAQWKAAGIDAAIDAKTSSEFIGNTIVGKYELAVFSVYKSGDPDFNHYFWTSANNNPYGAISINFNHYSSPTMDANLKTGRENPDFAARKKAYDDIVKELNTNVLNIWTFYTPISLLAATNVRGLQKASESSLVTNSPTWLGEIWLAK